MLSSIWYFFDRELNFLHGLKDFNELLFFLVFPSGVKKSTTSVVDMAPQCFGVLCRLESETGVQADFPGY
jgi:hypothetical protein